MYFILFFIEPSRWNCARAFFIEWASYYSQMQNLSEKEKMFTNTYVLYKFLFSKKILPIYISLCLFDISMF